ncbi:DUF4238 domain-containing protein [Ralstonia pseudosolanacearum]|uniref:DUF4238 domain-containing protein n=1 Tax=Ralstonia pseudosolanacearum TaxID=1310165 RepID=UPI0008D9908F|nr:DUF4238 domain-containing protein [Ralstonia pseudosolanacearum]MCL1622602.1 DUF4238 domain-containing protein [Ralstonia pseudosolanacearum CaRs-Mep]
MEYSKHKPEPVQPKNPHQLTRKQHIFPRASIERFRHATTGITAIRLAAGQRITNIDARNMLFCANHVWDQRAEGGFGAQIEGKFQALAERLIQGDTRWLGMNHWLITQFHALWEGRARYADSAVPGLKFPGELGERELTNDLKELLEARHTFYIDEENFLPSRQATGLHIQVWIMNAMRTREKLTWRLCRSSPGAGEFLVPDTPASLYIPLTPTLALLGDSNIDVAYPNVMKAINLMALAHSRRFVIAHDLSRCFIAYNEHRFPRPRCHLRFPFDPFPIDCEVVNVDVHQHA